MESVDVAVIGAGVSGLLCARTLAAAGRQVVVVEARAEVGGRLRTLRGPAGEVVELGAQVVHDTGDVELDELLAAVGLATQPLATDAVFAVVEGGTRHDAAALARRGHPPWLVEQRVGSGELDRATVAEVLAEIPAPSRATAWAWLEQVVGEDPGRLDARDVAAARIARSRGPEAVVTAGFDLLARVLADGLDLRCGAPVHLVRRSAAGFELQGPQPLRARAVVVTAPPSVVAAGRLRFDPELPAARRRAAMVLRSGDAVVFVSHAQRPATRSTWTLLVDPPGGLWRTTAGSHLVTGHVKGGAAARARGCDWSLAAASRVAAMLDCGLGQVLSVQVCDWGMDPWSGGAYSVPAVGAGAAAELWATAPHPGLHFAGEASAPSGLRGLVQGALASGQRAAQEVLDG